MAADEASREELADELGSAANVLLLAPSMGSADAEACGELLTIAAPAGTNLLCVDLTRSPDDRIAELGDVDPDDIAIVSVGDDVRSVDAPTISGGPSVPGLSTVSDPRDLTGIGIAITEALEDWQGSPNRTAVCVHSLTTLLQYADREQVFRFLHVVTGHMRTAGAVAHYHMDPGAHDERTVNMLTTLFDAVVEVDEDGAWTISTR